MTEKHNRVSFDIIVVATNGDIDSINRVINHYGPYIGKLSLRSTKDEFGNTFITLDETLRGKIQTSLIQAILSFDIE